MGTPVCIFFFFRKLYIYLSFTFYLFIYLLTYFLSFCLSGAAPAAHGGSQARGLIGTVDTGLRHSHSNAGSKLRLQPTPQLTETPDP